MAEPPAPAASASSGDRQVEGETVLSPMTVTTPSEAPSLTTIMPVDLEGGTVDEEPELPEMVAESYAEVARPSVFEEPRAALLSA